MVQRGMWWRFLFAVLISGVLVMAAAGTGMVGRPPGGQRENREAPWTVHIGQANEALGRGDMRAAERALRDAYYEALTSQRWERLIAVGDAYLRFGEAARFGEGASREARKAYAAALIAARLEGSLDGTLRVAEAYAALGNRETVDRILRLAQVFAAQARDAQGLARVQAVRERLIARAAGMANPTSDADPL